MPWPTADIGCALVKISASSPMPTSRYCDQAPCSISVCFRASACFEPGFSLRRSPPSWRSTCAADGGGLLRRALGLLLDDALEHGAGEGDAGGLDRLQVDRGPAARAFPDRASLPACWRGWRREAPSRLALRLAQKLAPGPAASHRSRMVAAVPVMSITSPPRMRDHRRARRHPAARRGRPVRGLGGIRGQRRCGGHALAHLVISAAVECAHVLARDRQRLAGAAALGRRVSRRQVDARGPPPAPPRC